MSVKLSMFLGNRPHRQLMHCAVSALGGFLAQRLQIRFAFGQAGQRSVNGIARRCIDSRTAETGKRWKADKKDTALGLQYAAS